MTYRRSSARSRLTTDSGPYEAVVVNNLDTRYMGGLEVEILKYTGSANTPEKSGELITVRYLSPFYGVTPNKGVKKNDGYENSQQSYGFWAVPPDIGTKVLVIFAEGNMNFGYWIGCVQDDYMNFMVPDGRASASRTTNATPENLAGAKLPVGEYNKQLETGELVDPTLFKKPFNKDFTGVLEVQGLLFDESRGTTTTSARREIPSMVFGISTPGPVDKRTGGPRVDVGAQQKTANVPFSRLGGSSFVMDDGDDKLIRKTHASDGPPLYVNREAGEAGGDETIPQNELLRLRTRTGHQIVLHNSEDLIYIGNSRGTAWIEISSDGKIDIHASDSISVMSNNDINFTAERDFNVEAGRNINMKATARYSDGNQFLDNKESGRIQLESVYNTNILVDKDYKLTVKGSSNTAVDLDSLTTVKQSHHLHANKNIHQTSDLATHLSSGQSFFRTSGKSIHDTAAKNCTVSALDVDVNVGQNYRLESGNVISQRSANEFKVVASNTATLYAGVSTHIEAATDVHIKAGTLIAGDAGQIHWNSGKSVPGTRAVNALNAVAAQTSRDAQRAEPLTTITLPFTFPGVEQPIPYESILSRAPQHEPWTHHENMNPAAFKPVQTDREDPGALPVNDRIITPDTFTKSLGLKTSKIIPGTSVNANYDGGTGDGQIVNGTLSQGSVASYGGNVEVDATRGSPGDITQTFFVGDGPLGTITSSKRGISVQVAEAFVNNFQNFIDDLEKTGYEIRTMLGYAKRQTISGGSWSIHSSGAAIDINPPNPVYNTFPNGFYSPRPANAPMTDMPDNTLQLANKNGLGWGGAWTSIDDAMHFSAYKGEGGAFSFRRGYIPAGPSTNRADAVPEIPKDAADISDPAGSGNLGSATNSSSGTIIEGSTNDNGWK